MIVEKKVYQNITSDRYIHKVPCLVRMRGFGRVIKKVLFEHKGK